MQQQIEVSTKDWKEEFAYYLKRKQKLKVTSDNNDILTFLNSYFEDLKEELNGISEGVVEHSITEYDGKFYALIDGYKSATMEYYHENEGIILKFITTNKMNSPHTISKRVAWLMADDNMPFIKSSFNNNHTPKGDSIIFDVEMLDKIVEECFMNVIQN